MDFALNAPRTRCVLAAISSTMAQRTRTVHSPTLDSQAAFSRQTVLSLDVTFRIGELFKQNRLFPHRHLEFEGVRPEPARYVDVQEVLQDLGLRIVSDSWREGAYPRQITLRAEGRLVEGRNVIILRITNLRYPITREVSYGKRVDTVEVPSGRMIIDVFGWADGPKDEKLTELLNQLQWQLKERFKYVRVS